MKNAIFDQKTTFFRIYKFLKSKLIYTCFRHYGSFLHQPLHLIIRNDNKGNNYQTWKYSNPILGGSSFISFSSYLCTKNTTTTLSGLCQQIKKGYSKCIIVSLFPTNKNMYIFITDAKLVLSSIYLSTSFKLT